MAALKTVLAGANKLAGAGDFSSALRECEKGLQTEQGGKSFQLQSLHGLCAKSLGEFSLAEKSFLAARLLEAPPQMQQKNTKFLSETYAELGNWKRYAEELTVLYEIAKEKSNMERYWALSDQIVSSYEKCQEYNAAATFLLNHLKQSLLLEENSADDILNLNRRKSVVRLFYLKDAYISIAAEKKTAKTSVGTEKISELECIFDEEFLQDESLYQLVVSCLNCLVKSKNNDTIDEADISHIGPLLGLLMSYLTKKRSDVFLVSASSSLIGSKLSSKFSAVTTYREIFLLAHEMFLLSQHFFDPQKLFHVFSKESLLLSCSSFLQICHIMVESWFFVSDQNYQSISDSIERGQGVVAALDTAEVDISSTNIKLTSTFLRSAKIMFYITEGNKSNAVVEAKEISHIWVKILKKHESLVTNSRKDTMKTPMTYFILTAAQMQESMTSVTETLCLCVAVALGALNGFRGDTFHEQLNLTDALYMTQEVSTRLLSLKKILLAMDNTSWYISRAEGNNDASPTHLVRGTLRQVLVELIPLGRIRMLFQIGQVEAGLNLCHDNAWLENSPSPVPHDWNPEEVKAAGSGESLVVNVEQYSRLLPVSRWVLLHTLIDGCYYGTQASCYDIERVTNAAKELVSATPLDDESVFESLCKIENAWITFLALVESTNSARKVVDLSYSTDLLRERVMGTEDIVAFIEKIQNIAASSKSPFISSYFAEIVQFRVGVAMWLGEGIHRNDSKKCLSQLIKAAQLNPQFGRVYSFIGHYYLVVLKDPTRAIKCYMKALAYDPMDREAGVSLSLLYIRTGEVVKLKKLWNDVNTLSACHAQWSFNLCGEMSFCLKDYEESINSFQRSLELCGWDIASWHRLSLSYTCLGQNVAAFKSLKCALAIIVGKNPSQRKYFERIQTMLMCELAEVERRMGCFQESFGHFEEVCEYFSAPVHSNAPVHSGDNIIALKGIGDVCLALAYERTTCGWTRGAFRSINRGIKAMNSILELYNLTPTDDVRILRDEGKDENVLACALKLKGDLCGFCSCLSPLDIKCSIEDCSEGLISVNVRECSYEWIIERLNEAEFCFRQLLTIHESQRDSDFQSSSPLDVESSIVSTWCDIGTVLYRQASLHLTIKGQRSGLFSTKFLLSTEVFKDGECLAARTMRRAMEAFCQGLLLQPSHSGCWNGVGVCCRADASLRELCLVRSTLSVEGEDPYPSGFTNLSGMFLSQNEEHCAKECLNALQLYETNPLHWVVLGGLGEKSISMSNSDSLNIDSVMRNVYDAYTAALEVSKPLEALLGVAVAYMKLQGFLSRKGELIWPDDDSWPLHVDTVSLKYHVEHPIEAFLYRCPLHPFAWSLLAWAYVQRQAWNKAAESYKSLLHAIELILDRRPLPHGNKNARTEEETFYVRNLNSFISEAIQGIELCGVMSALPPSIPNSSEFPNVKEFFPQFPRYAENHQHPLLTKENIIMRTFSEQKLEKCASLLDARMQEMLGSVQECDVDDQARLKFWIRWMQLIDYFILSTNENDKNVFLVCLEPVGHLLIALSPEENSSVISLQRLYVLNAFRIYPQGFLQVGQALLELGAPNHSTVSILELGLILHPRHDAMYRMLGRIEDSKLEYTANKSLSICQEMLSTSSQHDEYNTPEQSLLQDKNEVMCGQVMSPHSPDMTPQHMEHPQALLNDEKVDKKIILCSCPQHCVNRCDGVVPSFSDSAALNGAHVVKVGRRCNNKDRKAILTALFLDPSNAKTWATLAGCIFSDVALGFATCDEEGERDDIKEDYSESNQEEILPVMTGQRACLTGVFNHRDLIKTSADIVLLLHNPNVFQNRENFSRNSFHTSLAHLSLMFDWVAYNSAENDRKEFALIMTQTSPSLLERDDNVTSVESLQLISKARNLVFSRNFYDAIPLYEKAAHELMSFDRFKPLLSRILLEVGHVYSMLLLPEKACEHYKHSEKIMYQYVDNDSKILPPYSALFSAVAFARKAYDSGNYDDTVNAREHIDEICESTTSTPSHSASAHVVNALLWKGLSKPNKVKKEILEAKNLYSEIFIPF